MMDDPTNWLNNNDEYLAKSVAWLRLRLVRLRQGHKGTPNAFSTAAEFSPSPAEPPGGSDFNQMAFLGTFTSPGNPSLARTLAGRAGRRGCWHCD